MWWKLLTIDLSLSNPHSNSVSPLRYSCKRLWSPWPVTGAKDLEEVDQDFPNRCGAKNSDL